MIQLPECQCPFRQHYDPEAAVWQHAQIAGDVHYGFGFGVASYRGERSLGHGGGWSGYHRFLSNWNTQHRSEVP
jgi:hypothetical protein